MSQDLSPENEAFLAGQVATGIYSSRDEAIDASVGLLRQREQLVARLEESRRQLESGEFTRYDNKSLGRHFDELREKAKRAKKPNA